ncbi:hypothetical protein HJA82_29330 [Rhizobium bangladeshense]|uniref:hypothetical protein n=1 Tax=Rhizobium bangladeshense TaxID=1138189 RepID=UPI001C837B7D|nr:hypothetical protein [Rhizobium bangladeshense]MBX4911418.1 hypothetical protein [Rhizobium bangladeshense]
MTILQKAKAELATFERCSKSTCEELIAVLEAPTVVPITDDMVERAAKALEKKVMQSTYEWTDEQFEIWWNKDPYFVKAETGWGDAFGRGTRKNHLLWRTRIVLEAALQVTA